MCGYQEPGNHTFEWESGHPNSESAIGFAIGSTVPPFWVFLGWHFADSDRKGLVGLVNGSVGTVTSLDTRGTACFVVYIVCIVVVCTVSLNEKKNR